MLTAAGKCHRWAKETFGYSISVIINLQTTFQHMKTEDITILKHAYILYPLQKKLICMHYTAPLWSEHTTPIELHQMIHKPVIYILFNYLVTVFYSETTFFWGGRGIVEPIKIHFHSFQGGNTI